MPCLVAMRRPIPVAKRRGLQLTLYLRATNAAIYECASKFFAFFFGFEHTISMEDARLKMLLKNKKTIKIKNLFPTSHSNQPHATI